MKLKIIIIMVSILSLLGCNNDTGIIENADLFTTETGSITFNINWPSDSRVIPIDTDAIKVMIVQKDSTTPYENVIIERGIEESETTTIDLLPGDYEVYAMAVGNPTGGIYEVLAYGYLNTVDFITVTKNETTSAPITLKLISELIDAEYTTSDPDNISIGDTVTATLYLDTKMRPFKFNSGLDVIYCTAPLSGIISKTLNWVDNYYSFDFSLEKAETTIYGNFFNFGVSGLAFSTEGYPTTSGTGTSAFSPINWPSFILVLTGQLAIEIG
jgi:hypothetical protein